jgi:hypothetical protein
MTCGCDVPVLPFHCVGGDVGFDAIALVVVITAMASLMIL